VGLRVSAPPPAATWHREEAFKKGIESSEVLVRFDQCSTQGEAQQLTVMHTHNVNAVQGIQAFRHGERQALRA
jgi:hypothetical protein